MSAEKTPDDVAIKPAANTLHGEVWWSYACYNHLSELSVSSGSGSRSIDEILASVRHSLETSEKFKDEYPPYTRIEITRHCSLS